MVRRPDKRYVSCFVLAVSVMASPIGARSETRGPALVLAEGSIARGPLTALGRDLELAGEALSDVAVVGGNARVSGKVAGDLILLGGDVVLAATARIEGDVFALGGEIESEAGTWIGGKTASYPTFSTAWLTLLEGPSLGLSPSAPLVVGAKLALLAAWMFLVLLFLATGSRGVLSTSESVRLEPFRNFFVGLTGILAMVLAGLFFSAFAAVLVGVPLLILVVVAAIVLKLWGMVAVFHAVGRWLLFDFMGRRVSQLDAAIGGLLVLGTIKLLPFLGTWVWTAATLVGVGAALNTKFGRREPWFESAPSAT